ncbi:hypothetical protein [Brevibacterium antiquum]|uniref:LPXTG-motif cell wall anchor domain-containing protein n=1 Tax=Brevibacterium antiquum TaxID=234835 RepID=A0A2H1JJD8_9MICO|nr:hypothetical protein [Brevibacterium antiquum]SMX87521.1 hypothetical protein BANT10_02062 [Brevibacterium antiquum]
MKKLILAPAVALAFTGLVAAPVAAAETPSSSTQSDSTAAKAEQIKKEKAEKLAKEEAEQKKADEEKAAKDKAEQEKKDAAKKAADKKEAANKADAESGDDAKDAKKPAPKDHDKGEDSKDPEDPQNEVEKIDAQLKVATSSVSAEDLASDGLRVTVTGLEKGDKLTTSGLTVPATTAAADGKESLTLGYSGDAEDLKEGTKNFSVKVQRAGVAAQSLSGSTTIVEAQTAIDSDLTVNPDEITAEDLTDPDKGIQATITNLEEGDTVTDDLTDKPRTVDADGDFTFGVYYDGPAETLKEGPIPLTATVQRDGEEPETLNGEINLADEAEPQISLDTDEISAHDFYEKGLKVTGEGFIPESTVELRTQPDGSPGTFFHGEVTADAEGKISGTVQAPDDIRKPGAYTLSATDPDDESNSADVAFTVTEDDAVDPIDASLKVDPKKITAEDLSNKDKGVTVTVSGVKKGDKITDSLTGGSETADADGDYTLHLYYQGNPDSLEEGKVPFTVTIDREGTESQTLNGNINVVAEDNEDDGDDGDNGDTPEAPAEASFSVSPKTLEAADFANDKKGVTLAVEDCEPGADVHFAVTPKGIQVTAYENTVKADDEGKASVSVFGTSANVSAYVGSYTASATCGDDTMKESFTVTAGADGGGSDGHDNDGNDGSSQLPRTGADLGGLASGAILLLVGGAAIAMTGRRKKVGQSPSDF